MDGSYVCPALNVSLTFDLFGLFTGIQRLISAGMSKNVPEANVNGTTTFSPKSNTLVHIVRDHQTQDATFGHLTVGDFSCYTMERTAVIIPAGDYEARMEFSPHFQEATPHLIVPNRTYIEVHPANYPNQLEGCIAVGSAIDGDALDNSKVAFASLVSLLPATDVFHVLIS